MGEGRILADGAIGDGRMLAEKRHIFVLFAARILAQLVYFVSRGDSEGHPDADVRSPKSHEVCVVVLSVSVGQCSQHSIMHRGACLSRTSAGAPSSVLVKRS